MLLSILSGVTVFDLSSSINLVVPNSAFFLFQFEVFMGAPKISITVFFHISTTQLESVCVCVRACITTVLPVPPKTAAPPTLAQEDLNKFCAGNNFIFD